VATIWNRVRENLTGLGWVDVSVSAPEDPYPAMVTVEVETTSMLSDDAREYALLLLAAAEVADQATDEMVRQMPFATQPEEEQR
jgi:hypothetical protein